MNRLIQTAFVFTTVIAACCGVSNASAAGAALDELSRTLKSGNAQSIRSMDKSQKDAIGALILKELEEKGADYVNERYPGALTLGTPYMVESEVVTDTGTPTNRPVYTYPKYGYTDPYQQQQNPNAPDSEKVLNILEKIVNMGEKLYYVIINNSIVTTQLSYSYAMPQGMTAMDLQKWEGPKYIKGTEFYLPSYLGFDVAHVKYEIAFSYAGNYNGTGKYLQGVTMRPVYIWTAPGMKFNAKCSVPDATVGNAGTHENPISEMVVRFEWDAKWFNTGYGSESVYVRGDGFYKRLDSMFFDEEKTQMQKYYEEQEKKQIKQMKNDKSTMPDPFKMGGNLQ